MNTHYAVFWGVLALIFALGCLWQIRENKRLVKQWYGQFDAPTVQKLKRLTWSRSLQFFIILGAGLLILGSYDWRLQETTENVDILQQARQEQEAQLAAAQAEAAAQQSQLRTELQQAQDVQRAQINYYPQPIAPVATPAANGLEDLYNPEVAASGNSAVMDGLKKRYEEMLVNNMFLKKCGRARPTDVHIIMSSLSQEMASINAPGRLQYDILTAARGSFAEMYADSPCDSQAVTDLQLQYEKYIDTLTAQLN